MNSVLGDEELAEGGSVSQEWAAYIWVISYLAYTHETHRAVREKARPFTSYACFHFTPGAIMSEEHSGVHKMLLY